VGNLSDELEKVRDRETFFDFVRALIEDRIEKATGEDRNSYGGQPGGWENTTIESYLDAALHWAQDSLNKPTGMQTEPSWREFATFLYCGKIYE